MTWEDWYAFQRKLWQWVFLHLSHCLRHSSGKIKSFPSHKTLFSPGRLFGHISHYIPTVVGVIPKFQIIQLKSLVLSHILILATVYRLVKSYFWIVLVVKALFRSLRSTTESAEPVPSLRWKLRDCPPWTDQRRSVGGSHWSAMWRLRPLFSGVPVMGILG